MPTVAVFERLCGSAVSPHSAPAACANIRAGVGAASHGLQREREHPFGWGFMYSLWAPQAFETSG